MRKSSSLQEDDRRSQKRKIKEKTDITGFWILKIAQIYVPARRKSILIARRNIKTH